MMSRFASNEELDKEVLYILNQHVGQENAIDRWDLVAKLFGAVAIHLRNDSNREDREIRESVSRLRTQGKLICDLGNGQGRYMAATKAEFWAMYRRYEKPIETGKKTLKAMMDAAEEKWEDLLQMKMEM